MTSSGPSSPASGLRFLLDSADRAAWAKWLPLGCFHGVTTNPILLEAAGVPCTLPTLSTLARQAFDLGAGEVHMQTWGRTRDLYVEHGRALAAIDPRIVVKVPTTVEGVAAAATLPRRRRAPHHDGGLFGGAGAGGERARRRIRRALLRPDEQRRTRRLRRDRRDGAGGARARLVHAHSRRLAPRRERPRPARRRGARHLHLRPETRRGPLRRRPRGEAVEAFEKAAERG